MRPRCDILLIVLFSLLALIPFAHSEHGPATVWTPLAQNPDVVLKREDDFVQAHCFDDIEVALADGTRVDCLGPTYAIEYDFTSKWAEALGQSLHYATMTNRLPGIVLICRSKRISTCQAHVDRLYSAITHVHTPVYVEVLYPQGLDHPTDSP